MARHNTRPPLPQTGFEELVRPHLYALFALAWRFTHNTALAQDLVQDTLLKAYRFFHRFETGTNFWAWLLTIMRNLYFSQRRKRHQETTTTPVESLPLAAEPALVDSPAIPEFAQLEAMLPYLVTDDVLRALDELPEEYRTTVLLADLLEYSYKDIAATMHCPMGTVMSRLHRGRQMLQARLQQYAVDHGYIRAVNALASAETLTTADVLQEGLVCA